MKWYNFYTVDKNAAPQVFVEPEDNMMQLYYLQNKELIEKSVAIDVYSNYTRYDINKDIERVCWLGKTG